MNTNRKYHSSAICFLLSILIITVFVSFQSSQMIFASGISIYSPFSMNYEGFKSPYFEYCGIFESCLRNDIRIFPFMPLTTHAQDSEQNNEDPFKSASPVSANPASSIIPFELPFP
ncbi:MAG: hypothetical protein QOA19_03235 [Nitrososphaeraceae archaeon]|nr:hypothetical protein [Nitrososphaeraceae archaeon]MDW0183067.1 hypothetical protein [Nitrososphaeraceae archaeon]MDW0193234.1 hypothetical protein [Nitrososphaeraceae archaeon]MDW0197142.1 hypothetical protein [Nitrososphaeraceae archaeon]MDW0200342.1 hypothetical protein [Nitrososphaeraceae archaeon]